MSKVLDKTRIRIDQSNTILGFATTGDDNWKVWDRFITVEGKPAYHIGNICGTCSFFFERLGGANQKVSPTKVAAYLKEGLTSISDDLLNQIKLIIPVGDYVVSLLQVSPWQVSLGTQTDYFSNEQVDLWGKDGFWGMPQNPRVNYYRSLTASFGKDKGLFEFIIPMYPNNWLNEQTVTAYEERIVKGEKPTAISLSILDVKQPANWEDEQVMTEHWCLAHYLIDGHHKTAAAWKVNKPITILSFLAIKHSLATEENISTLFDVIEEYA